MPTVTKLTYLDLLCMLSPHPKPIVEIIAELTGKTDVEAHAEVRRLKEDAADEGYKIIQITDAGEVRCWALSHADYKRICREMGLD